jgi:predicted AlkP superfamily pyrophosphatase or phosphodiesterase
MRFLALLLLLAGCTCSDPVKKRGRGKKKKERVQAKALEKAHGPVMLIGADGLDCDLIAPMLKAGELPNLARLMSAGVAGKLDTLKPAKSPVIWTTIATGTNKKRHGITGFMKKRKRAVEPELEQSSGEETQELTDKANSQGLAAESTKRKTLVRSTDRKVKALWNIASDNGRSVATIGWWVTWPVEPINGVMVAQTNTVRPKSEEMKSKTLKGGLHADMPGQIWPLDRQEALVQTIEQVESTMPERIAEIFGGPIDVSLGPEFEHIWNLSRWSIRADLTYHELAKQLLEERKDDPFDLFMVYYGGTDVLAHRYFRWAYPEKFTVKASEEQMAAYGHVLPSYYRAFDKMLGELVDRAPADANVIVVSDHGMHAVNPHKPFTGDEAAGKMGGRRLSGGHHTAPPACIVAAGPQIIKPTQPLDLQQLAAGTIPRIGRVLTITPTILHILGIPSARDMKARPSKQILDAAFLEAYPVGRIDTHTPPGWKVSVVDVNMEERDEKARREQLRTLGYIE